jgi:hypothetical protein
MNPEQSPLDPKLEQAIQEIRDTEPDQGRMEAAADRVWSRLSAERHDAIRGCDGFRMLFEDYRAGRLTAERKVLVKDHLHECVACRKAYDHSPKVVAMPVAARHQAPVMKWAMAAAALVVVGLGTWTAKTILGPKADATVTVENLSGKLYRVAGGGLVEVKAGERLAAGSEIRSARDANAMIRLADGSLVEMRERSSLAVNPQGSDLAVRLTSGSVIVEASKRGSGHLFVNTRDCRVAVTGTVFGVTSGVKGSRVAVVEGEVHVAQARTERVLRPGDQYASSQTMSPVAVADEIAWSKKVDSHLALLKDFSKLRQDLAAVNLPAPRYSSRLLRYVPTDAMVYASVPNLGDALAQANTIIEQRKAESPALREWMEQKHDGIGMREMLDEVRQFSSYLGDEVVIVVSGEGKSAGPLFLAETRKSGLQDFIKAETNRLSSGKAAEHVRFAAGPTEVADGAKQLQIMETGNLIAMSTDPAVLRQVAGIQQGGSTVADGTFLTAIQSTYRDGAGFLFAVNMEKLIAEKADAKTPPGLRQVRTLMIHDNVVNGKTQTHAEVNFDGIREGIAAWLAAPGPLVVLDYVSSDATVVSAVLLKTPAVIIDELFAYLSANNANFAAELAKVEGQIGLKIREDLAAPLGTQYLFALDGPALPPSWKVVAEVYDAQRLQSSIEHLVDTWKTVAAQEGKPAVALTKAQVNGRVYYTLTGSGAKLTEAHYTYDKGFLIAAASRQLVDRALQVREMGGSLSRSQQFQQLVPRDRFSNFSGMLYYNLAAASEALSTLSPGGALTPEQQGLLQKLTGDTKPQLFTVYGEENRITFASTGSLVGMGLDTMFSGSILSPLHKKGGTMRANPSYR